MQEPPAEQPTPTQHYGAAQPEELQAVAYNPDNFQRRNVVVRGHLTLLGADTWAIADGGAQLLIIPFTGLSPESLREVLGRRVEVTGVVRKLPEHQGTCNRGQWPQSKCDDPTLPPIPDRRPEWPPGSITVTRVVDLDVYRRPATARRATSLGDALADPAARAGKSVRVVGQFRGANLFRDVPADSRREAGDWVLKDGDQALWITGKPPRGKGFDLDPGSKSDTGRWLEVEGKLLMAAGKLVTAGDVVYLKASRVQLVARPPAPADDKP
jgi:hypothetical protein